MNQVERFFCKFNQSNDKNWKYEDKTRDQSESEGNYDEPIANENYEEEEPQAPYIEENEQTNESDQEKLVLKKMKKKKRKYRKQN